MPNEIVRADWIREDIFWLRDRNSFPIVMTQPWGVNGADLLPMSLIGCALWDIVTILRKQRQHVIHASGWAESEREDQAPWRYKRIALHYRFQGNKLHPERVQRAIELSQTKYCSIYATLAATIELDSDFEILEGGLLTDSEILKIVVAFNDALNAHDVEGMMQCQTADCVFENTYPSPDGTRYEGQAAVRAFWQEFLRASPNAHIEMQELFATNDRCVMRWTYHWVDTQGKHGHVRGVDVYRVENNLIAEKLSYVKG